MEKQKTGKSWNGLSLAVLILLVLAEGLLLLRVWKLNMLPELYFAILAGVLVVVTCLLCLLLFRGAQGKWSKKPRHGKQIVGYFLSALIVGLCVFAQGAVGKVQGTIEAITAPEEEKIVLEIYVLKEDKAQYLQDAAGYTFALPGDISDGELAPLLEELQEVLQEDLKTVTCPNAIAQIDALLDGEVNAVVLNSAYLDVVESMEGYEDITEEIREIHERTIQMEAPILPTTPVRDPDPDREERQSFLMYFSGKDSRSNIQAIGRSDVNILVAVNPETHQILLVNTPRDCYVINPASGDDSMDKLTHCGLKGVENSVAALEILYQLDIDYYARINFSGFEALVDAVGGVTIYSDVAFTAHHEAFIQKGENRLNGKQALSFARERKTLKGGDNTRGKNQMKLITALVQELTAENLLMNYSEILESLEGMFTTNFPTEEISKLVRMQLSEMPEWEIYSFAVTGNGAHNSCWAAGGGYAYVMYPHEDVVERASELIEKVLSGERIDEESVQPAE